MDTLHCTLSLLLVTFPAWGQGHECDVGCAPAWQIPEPSLCTVHRLQGEDVDFRCTAFGNPRPYVTWSRNGRPMGAPFRGRQVALGPDSLRLVDLDPHDTGSYTCFVQNRFGSLQWSIYLTVYERYSEQTDGPLNTTVSVNDTATFWCRIDVDDVDATVTWFHDVINATGFTEERLIVKRAGFRGYDHLTLRPATSRAGRYTCFVETSLTSVRRVAWLNDAADARVAESRSTGNQETPLGRYFRLVALVAGVMASIALVAVLTLSAAVSFRNQRRPICSGVTRLQEELLLEL